MQSGLDQMDRGKGMRDHTLPLKCSPVQGIPETPKILVTEHRTKKSIMLVGRLKIVFIWQD